VSRLTLLTTVIVTGLLAAVVALVASAPRRDAEIPEWMEPMVDAGRSSLLDHLDLIEPGSPLVLVSAQCRDDGAVRLLFENRWLWVVHRQYYAEAGPGWTSGSMGGGTLHSSDDWLSDRTEVGCTDRPASSFGPHCAGDGFTIGYPAGWWVHPADARLDIEPCAFFAAEPFVAEREEDDFGVGAAQVSIWVGSGCRGSFDRVTRETEMVVDGRRVYRHELERGEGGPEPRALEYVVWLRGGVPCETSRWLVARTESDDPGDHAANRRVLDQMIQSLDLDPPGE
jgi:hypothetical protein